MMPTSSDLPVLAFASQSKWADWLAKNHDTSDGLWMKVAKKDSGIPSVTIVEALDMALCYGWIDGQRGSFDDKYYLQKYTPRRPKSTWSKINVEKVKRLIASGQMQPAGLKAIEAAKADGRWEKAYDGQRTMTVPKDFQAALNKNKKAKAFFETLNSVNRFAILFRIHNVKKAETRTRKIKQFIEMLENNEKIYG
ncbi:MAG: YdeI/OmpD-associated family protein [Anaerolineales bacterium]|nr:YdeI/OmpD-associated family protein [Anaerolineales bacterium]